ncbi:MAG TPA: ACP phosphodiesterase [Prolixibacteraceae bacterium]|nr:ACP phosphodiesterase [Prolixibacteraceae bacterium]
MNYLAHIYLSGDSEDIVLGNFIGDFVKGNRHQHYPEQVAYGILLHRRIDSFTDQHEAVIECIRLLRPGYGKYAGIVADVFFDHFLAHNWNDYSVYTLRSFAKNAHAIFLSNFGLLPMRLKQFLPFLIHHRRLESYAVRENLHQVLDIMSKRTSLPSNTGWAMQLLNDEYAQFEAHFRRFFPELINYVESDYGVMIKRP